MDFYMTTVRVFFSRVNRLWPVMESAAIGLLAGALCAVWLRALDAWLGNTLFTHAAAWLVIAIGLLAGLMLGTRQTARTGAWALFASGAWCLVLLPFINWMIRKEWILFLSGSGRTIGVFLAVLVFAAGLALIIPSGGVGLALGSPRMRTSMHLTLCVAFALLSNWLIRQFVFPVYGLECVFRYAALVSGALASLRLLQEVPRAWTQRALSALPFLLAVALTELSLWPSEPIGSVGAFGRWASRDDIFSDGQLIKHVDACSHAYSLFQHPVFGQVIIQDGAPLAYGECYRSGRILAAHIPFLLYPDAKRVAVMGPRAAIALGSIETHPLAQIDCLAPVPEIVAWARSLDARPDHSSNMCVTVQSGLVPSRWKSHAYDVVFIASGAAWESDACEMLSASALNRCKQAVAENGCVALDLNTRGFSGDDFVRVLRVFHQVFPHVQLWCTASDEWLLIGTAHPIKVPADRMLERFEIKPVFHDLVRGGAQSLPVVLACFVCGTDGVEKMAGPGDGPSAWRLACHVVRNQLASVRTLRVLATAEPCRACRMNWLLPGMMDPDVFVALLNRTGVRVGARTLAIQFLFMDTLSTDAKPLAGGEATDLPEDPLMLEQIDRLDADGQRFLAAHYPLEAAHRYESILRIAPELASAHYWLAMAVQQKEQTQAAFWHFAHAVQLAPNVAEYRIELGRVALTLDQSDEAIRQFRAAVALEPQNAEALHWLSRALATIKGGDTQEAMKLAEKACVLTKWQNPDYVWCLADRYLDAGRIKEGVALKRKLKEMGYSQ